MINLGIIGISTIFTSQIQALLELSDIYRIVAVYDEDVQKCHSMEELQNIPIYDTLEAFLNAPDMDTVAIMTPPANHTSLTEMCLRAYKHVLLEKPATLHLGELEKLYALAQWR
jgi:predicted dehydrogenase